MITNYARPIRPHVHEHENQRGAVCWAIAGDGATVRVRTAHASIRDFSVSTALLPAGCQVGDPLVVTCAGCDQGTAGMSIVAIAAGTFAPGFAPSDNAAAVAAGQFFPAGWQAGTRYYDGD